MAAHDASRSDDKGTLTRRALLGAAAAASLAPLACRTPRGGNAEPRVIAARGATSSPDVESLLAQMTVDEKIGQMTQVDCTAVRNERDVRDFFIGSVLSGGDSLPHPNEPTTWADMYDRLQGEALATRLGIPMIYGIDAVHGLGTVRGATIFPHNIGLGCTRDVEVVAAAARTTAREMAGTGIDWTFAPCIAVARDERWGRTYESFAETPELVASLGTAAIQAYQHGDPATTVLATAKHFLADGGTAGGKDQGDARISEDELRSVHLPAYVAAIKADVASVMISYSSWNGARMHGNRHLVTEVLKGELGFRGFVVSDWAAVDKLGADYRADVEQAINAGIDMVMVPTRFREFIADMKDLVAAGRISMARIDDAVRRILRQKARFQIWERPFADRALTPEIGSPAHRAIARAAVGKSLVVLKNERQVLPLDRNARIHVCGTRADDVGAQCGGWSVGWRGRRGNITAGTTVRAAIEKVVGSGRIDFSPDGAGGDKADVVVVVIGEDPYAEGSGDRTDLALSPQDTALVSAAKRSGKPIVVLLLSGRPMILGDVLPAANALVAAWLPGTEGDGIADVLFGAVKPTGKLSFSWPANMSQIPINVGDKPYAPLFPYGFGLRW